VVIFILGIFFACISNKEATDLITNFSKQKRNSIVIEVFSTISMLIIIINIGVFIDLVINSKKLTMIDKFSKTCIIDLKHQMPISSNGIVAYDVKPIYGLPGENIEQK
jgi:hypothetical protein